MQRQRQTIEVRRGIAPSYLIFSFKHAMHRKVFKSRLGRSKSTVARAQIQ